MTYESGIWIDLKHAWIAHFNNGETKLSKIDSEVDDSKVGGGARSKLPYGPMDKSDEKKHLRRKSQQIQMYLKEVMKHLQNTDKMIIVGPGEVKGKLLKYIQENHKHIEVVDFANADKMTENQFKALVRDHFDTN